LTKSAAAGKPELFDLAAAHELYGVLFGPVEALIKDKRHVFMVPSGPLTPLPFHLLVTEKPSVAVPQIKDIVAYRDAAWLVKRHAVTVLPSVTSLKALRVFTGKDQGTKPMTSRARKRSRALRAPSSMRAPVRSSSRTGGSTPRRQHD
jgi:hypothetical protein